jgi:hypothetical protein
MTTPAALRIPARTKALRQPHSVPTLPRRNDSPVPRPIAEADIEWLRARRVGGAMPKTDAGTLVSEMRDEGEK